MSRFYEYVNKPLGSVKCRGFLDQVSDYQVSGVTCLICNLILLVVKARAFE
jgi:hypothetical protein